jgi:hypothetical protein
MNLFIMSGMVYCAKVANPYLGKIRLINNSKKIDTYM